MKQISLLSLLAAVTVLSGCAFSGEGSVPAFIQSSAPPETSDAPLADCPGTHGSSELFPPSTTSLPPKPTSTAPGAPEPATASTPEDSDGSLSDENIYYALYPAEQEFADSSLFVGDSICLGLMAYNIIPPQNVYATGGAAARNLFDIPFYYMGKECSFADALAASGARHVLFWLGINDVNMTTAAQFCENYSALIDAVLEGSDADVYVCAITPTLEGFTEDGRIDEFNAAMREYIAEKYPSRVAFADFTAPLTNKHGRLKSYFSGGDKVHLAPMAYYAALHELFAQVGA